MKKLALIVTFFLLQNTAFADGQLIGEMTKLRNSLALDDPSRDQLTLRLADLHFDEAVVLAGNAASPATIMNHREQALSLYNEALRQTASDMVTLRSKIKFQIARVYLEINEKQKGASLFEDVLQNSSEAALKRESALRLGEMAETENSGAALRKALGYYATALKYCESTDLCSYINYRLGWVSRNLGDMAKAIAYLKSSLFDAKGQVREEALRDWLVFQGSVGGSAQAALREVDDLARQLKRPNLLEQLADAFFSSGNAQDGVEVLALAHSRTPSLKSLAKLLEEYYGFRRWDQFRSTLNQAIYDGAKLPQADELVYTESEKIIRRLIVQLDGERITRTEALQDFQNSVALYLLLFKTSNERAKIMEGWVAAEKSAEKRIVQLKTWLTETTARLNRDEASRLHKLRAVAAQEAKDNAVLIEEMKELLVVEPDSREYRYQLARAYYETHDYDLALPLFRELAAVIIESGKKTDRFAIQSKHLILDILNERKDYASLINETATVTANDKVKGRADLAQLSSEIMKIEEQAKFELAVQLSASSQPPSERERGLEIFRQFCVAKILAEKSCENARVLAINLSKHDVLLEVLRQQGKNAELAVELEVAGYFAQAASLHEKELAPNSLGLKNYIRVALFYEIEGQLDQSTSILSNMIAKIQRQRSFGEDETLAYFSLRDSPLLAAQLLKLPWTDSTKRNLAHELERRGIGNEESRLLILQSPQSLGPAWPRVVQKECRRLEEAAQKTSFYGANSKRKFEQRVAAVQKLEQKVQFYLAGADPMTRIELMYILKRSHHRLAVDVLNTPLPPGLEPGMQEQIRESLKTMAAPFIDKSRRYNDLILAEYQKLEPPNQALKEKLEAGEPVNSPLIAETLGSEKMERHLTAEKPTSDLANQVKAELRELHLNPKNDGALLRLKTLFETSGKNNVASYFEGRLRQTKEEM